MEPCSDLIARREKYIGASREAPAALRALGWIEQIELTLTFGQREAISASMKSRTSRDFGRSVGMIR
jgi:hypothetical protein